MSRGRTCGEKRLRNPTKIPENRIGVQLVQREAVQRVQNCLSRDRAVLGKAALAIVDIFQIVLCH